MEGGEGVEEAEAVRGDGVGNCADEGVGCEGFGCFVAGEKVDDDEIERFLERWHNLRRITLQNASNQDTPTEIKLEIPALDDVTPEPAPQE